jgi:hypothetical protein
MGTHRSARDRHRWIYLYHLTAQVASRQSQLPVAPYIIASGAAAILGLKATTLEARMAKMRIKRPKQDSNNS